MKNFILGILFCLGFTIFATVSIGDKITAKRFNESTFGVGDIKTSLLTEVQFQAQFGTCWVSMIGQDVSGSDYTSITGNNSLPDVRGRFARTIGGSAPALGQTQEDAFQGHHHATQVLDGRRLIYADTGLQGGNSGGHQVEFGDTSNLKATSPESDGINGTPRIANETRPQNYGVNSFIKINHECN